VIVIILTVAFGVVGLCVAVWAGGHVLRGAGPTSSSNAFGGFDVFDPGLERSKRELQAQAQAHQTVVTPSPDDLDQPVSVNLRTNTARIRPPRP
jgi:hypothetical protein